MQEIINSIFLYLGFILWIIFIWLWTKKELLVNNKNIFNAYKIGYVIFMIILFLYTRMKHATVSVYLFDAIMLFFIVNLLYKDDSKKLKINIKNTVFILFNILIGLIPIIYYIIYQNKIRSLIFIIVLYFVIPIFGIIYNYFNKKLVLK